MLLGNVINAAHAHCLLLFIANVWKMWYSKVIDRYQVVKLQEGCSVIDWTTAEVMNRGFNAAMTKSFSLKLWEGRWTETLICDKWECANIPIYPDRQPVVGRWEEEGACGIKSDMKQNKFQLSHGYEWRYTVLMSPVVSYLIHRGVGQHLL